MVWPVRTDLDLLRGTFSGTSKKAGYEQPVGDSIFHPRVGAIRKERTEVLWKVVFPP